jgi:hypothetical protein
VVLTFRLSRGPDGLRRCKSARAVGVSGTHIATSNRLPFTSTVVERFTFGSPSSTSGHLMPRFFMLKDGIDPDKDFKNVAFSGAHDATVAFVASGKADGGALNASVLDKLLEKGDANAQRVKVIATTPPYYDYNWTVRPGLDPALVKKLSDAFLKLDPANPAQTLVTGGYTTTSTNNGYGYLQRQVTEGVSYNKVVIGVDAAGERHGQHEGRDGSFHWASA